VQTFAELLGVEVNFVDDIVAAERGMTPEGKKIYALGDIYPHADIVTYPSLLEGFGNAFLEAVYFRRPIVVNNYTIYAKDIKPKGFRAIEFDGYITDSTVDQVRKTLGNRELIEEMTEHNYNLAKKNFSFDVLESRLPVLLKTALGHAK
jgi:glycosyltransferase involved in cell wall biosynthesis